MKLLLIANLYLISNCFHGNTIALADSTESSTTTYCNFSSTENEAIITLELSNSILNVTAQTLMGFVYADPDFSKYINLLLTNGSAQNVYTETGIAINEINDCYTKLPGYTYTWQGVGDDGAIIARVVAGIAQASNFPNEIETFINFFQIMDNTASVEFQFDFEFYTWENGEVNEINFQGFLTKHLSNSLEHLSYEGHLYVYTSESGSLINFDGTVQVCNGTAIQTVGVSGVSGILTSGGLVNSTGFESFLVLPNPPQVVAKVMLKTKAVDGIAVFVGNYMKVLDAAPTVGLVANADKKFQAFIYSVFFGNDNDITVATNNAYKILSECGIISSK